MATAGSLTVGLSATRASVSSDVQCRATALRLGALHDGLAGLHLRGLARLARNAAEHDLRQLFAL